VKTLRQNSDNVVSFLAAAAAMLVVGLLSGWPALRAIRRVDLATVLRERTG
jgi:hypothetical protein